MSKKEIEKEKARIKTDIESNIPGLYFVDEEEYLSSYDTDTQQKLNFQFKLDQNGKILPSTLENPNPVKFFGQDQSLNGRLRDIAYSKDGRKIYLINNGGTSSDKIIVYTYLRTGNINSCRISST